MIRYLLFVLFLSPWGPILAQSEKALIKGTVRDSSGAPLYLADIVITGEGVGTTSDKNGSYELRTNLTGSHRILCSLLGYEKKSKKILLDGGKVHQVDFHLKRKGVQLHEVSITGGIGTKTRFERAEHVDVIENQEKREEQTASLGETIDQKAGVDNISTGNQAGKPVIRGLSGNRVRVLMDGIPMDHQQYGVRHMPNVDPYLSERIEVLHGPSTISYGSDAMGGVVNIIPLKKDFGYVDSTSFDGRILSSYQTNNKERTAGGIFKTGKSRVALTGGIIYRQGGNIRTPKVPTYAESGKEGDPKFSGELPHTGYEQIDWSLGAGYKGESWSSTIDHLHWENEQDLLLPSGEGLGQALRNDLVNWKTIFFPGNHWTIKSKIGFSRNHRKSNTNGRTKEKIPNNGPAHLDLVLNAIEGGVDILHPEKNGFEGKIGIEYRHSDHETRGTGEPLLPSYRIRNFGIYLLEEMDLGPIRVNIGARYDHRDQTADPHQGLHLPDPDSGETRKVLSQNYDPFSYSLGFNYTVNDHFAISSTFSKGFRAPSMFELHADGIHGGIAAYQTGTPDLSPEYSYNVDLSLKWRSEYHWFRITGYRNLIQNYIYAGNIGVPNSWEGPPIMKVTQGNAELIGGTVEISAELSKWVELEANGEIVKGTNLSEGEKLPLIPAPKVQGGIRFKQEDLGPLKRPYLKVGIQHAFGKKAAGRYEPFWQFENLPQFGFGVASTDPYTLLNAGIGFTWTPNNRPIHFNFSGHNLLNTPYRDFLDTYKGYALGMGRNFHLKLSIPIL